MLRYYLFINRQHFVLVALRLVTYRTTGRRHVVSVLFYKTQAEQ